MVLNKKSIQEEVDKTLANGEYTEGLGELILLFAEVSTYKRGLYFRYNEFEIEFIIKPRIVDMLLLKVWKYNKDNAQAYTFFSLVTSTAIIDAIRDIRRSEIGESANVYYIDDIIREIANLEDDSSLYSTNDVYLDGDLIKLN